MSLDVYLTVIKPTEIYSANITHNLRRMAAAAGLCEPLWRPEEIGITKASQLLEPLRKGLERLKADPDYYRTFNPENGWGSYEGLVKFVENYMEACGLNQDADIEVNR